MRTPLGFAQVREDPRIELALAGELAAGGRPVRVLTVASGGCTALSLLAADEDDLDDAIDANPAQIALCALKRAVLAESGDLAEARALLGDAPAPPGWRVERLRGLLDGLSEPVRRFWLDREGDLERGVLSAGRFERLFAALRAWLHELVAPSPVWEAFFEGGDAGRLLESIDRGFWEVGFGLFFDDRPLLEMFGPAAVQHAPRGSYAAYFRSAFERAIRELPAGDNYFLSSIVLGRTLETPGGGPPYLRSPTGERARARLDRLRLEALDVGRFLATRPPGTSYDLVNLSNVFDWMDDRETEDVCSRLVPVLAPGALVVLRQINNERPLPSSFLGSVEEDEARGRELHASDRSFFYGRVRVWRRPGLLDSRGGRGGDR